MSKLLLQHYQAIGTKIERHLRTLQQPYDEASNNTISLLICKSKVSPPTCDGDQFLRKSWIISPLDSMDSMSRITKFAQVHKHVQQSVEVVKEALARFTIEKTCISFNGGKDCTAVLHLVHSVACLSSPNNNQPRLTAFYAQLPNHFKEESEFVMETVERYNLNLLQYSSSSLKDSLNQLKRDAPHIETIFIGTRKNDLKAGTEMQAFAPTDNGWPKFMRVNPILDWSYCQVWEFIHELNVPYCDLYNQGYSSLGTSDNTVRNSNLLRYHADGTPYYLPAWWLTSSHEERLSRSSSRDAEKKVVDAAQQ